MPVELPGGFVKDVVGYCDPLSVRAGTPIQFKLSSVTPGPVDLAMVRLISGDDRPHGTGLIEQAVAAELPAHLQVQQQPLITGSAARIPDMPAHAAGCFRILVFPTLLRDEPQTVANLAGVLLQIHTQGWQVTCGDTCLSLPFDMQLRRWHQVELSFGAQLGLKVERLAAGVGESGLTGAHYLDAAQPLPAGDWWFAATVPGQQHFNGRLEAPSLWVDEQVVAQWDFAQQMHSSNVINTVDDRHGQLLQTPTRAVAGHRWDGSVQNMNVDPSHYAAIHFHEDDLTDAQWQDSFTFDVPADWRSGQYALKVTQGESEDYVPFFVRPRPGQRSADLLYLVPTASYIAYANQRLVLKEGPFGSAQIRNANTAYLAAYEEVGNSLYEYHRDHSGVHFSSRLRPILNLKPHNITWAFNADTHITAWLTHIDEPFDVLTDEDLHLEGAAALAGYRTVITGTHPEYYSSAMRDALSEWLADNGRLMYMGGNGFYWRIAYDPENPAIIEVRRAEDGTRAWIAQPGEYYQQFDGEYGGLWRRLGKPPNELVGVGFAAQGFDGGTHYRVQPGALDPRVAFALQGLDTADTWGAFGNQGGGAAGEEIDRWDEHLGSPAHAVILASSENHRPGMLRAKEEFHMMEQPVQDEHVRADMVFFEVPGGGAVFSTGSISYAGSLAHNQYQNEIARLTENVLRRFLHAEPFVFPQSG